MIKAILFDFDGTLLNRDLSLMSFINDQYERFSNCIHHIPKQLYIDRFIELDNHGYTWKDQVYRQLVDEFKIQNVSADELLNDYIKNFHHHCIAFPNLFKMLHLLKSQKYKLGIITNGKCQFQMDNIVALGLDKVMDTILISEWENIKKPNPEIFHRALQKLEVNAFESVYVGDHLENDIKAAKNVGMIAIWKKNTQWNNVEAEYVVDDLLDLPNIINKFIM